MRMGIIVEGEKEGKGFWREIGCEGRMRGLRLVDMVGLTEYVGD